MTIAWVMEGLVIARGAAQLQRIPWSREADGPHQVWETSDDDGRTWKVLFDGRHRRR